MLESIITSRARIKLLLKFFMNPEVKAYLRELSSEFGGSTNAVRVELNRLVKAKLLKIEKTGRNKYYSANTEHPLYPEINSILYKMTGLDQIYHLMSKVGRLEAAYITGDYARGIDGGIVDLVLVGDLEKQNTHDIISKTEELINRKIRSLILTKNEFIEMNENLRKSDILPLWGNGENSIVSVAKSVAVKRSHEVRL